MKLISTEEHKQQSPELVELWNNMTREQLLEEVWKESTDAVNMESRVALFMEYCSNGMSKTNYTLESIQTLIDAGKESDIREWCRMTFDDSEGDDQYIIEEVKTMAQDDYLNIRI